jgi:hypothetical protein
MPELEAQPIAASGRLQVRRSLARENADMGGAAGYDALHNYSFGNAEAF